MARIALLIQETPTLEDGNYLRFARELDKSGHSVDIMFVDSLRLLAGRVTADAFSWRSHLRSGSPLPTSAECKIDHDVIWICYLREVNHKVSLFQI